MATLIKQNPQRLFMIVLGWELKMDWDLDIKQHKNVMVIPPRKCSRNLQLFKSGINAISMGRDVWSCSI